MPRGTTQQRQALIDQINKEFGEEFAHIGTFTKTAEPIPTGSIALDYALGTGGWPRGCIIGVYGKRDIGKSVLALHALANAQKMGLGVAYIALEQKWHPHWVEEFAVLPEEVIVSRPDTAEKAFDILFKLVDNPYVDFIVFDSIGALATHTEVYGTDTTDAKAKVGGQSGVITHGLKRVPRRVWKGQKTIMLLNQARQVISAQAKGGIQQPGGEALEHFEEVIIQLSPGGDKFTYKPTGEPKAVQYGQEVAAIIVRNQRAKGSRKTARYDFYEEEYDGHRLGIDQVKDVINTAIRSGVAKSTSQGWFTIDGVDKKFQKGSFATYLEENPPEMDRIRELVLEKAYGKTGNNEVPVT